MHPQLRIDGLDALSKKLDRLLEGALQASWSQGFLLGALTAAVLLLVFLRRRD